MIENKANSNLFNNELITLLGWSDGAVDAQDKFIETVDSSLESKIRTKVEVNLKIMGLLEDYQRILQFVGRKRIRQFSLDPRVFYYLVFSPGSEEARSNAINLLLSLAGENNDYFKVVDLYLSQTKKVEISYFTDIAGIDFGDDEFGVANVSKLDSTELERNVGWFKDATENLYFKSKLSQFVFSQIHIIGFVGSSSTVFETSSFSHLPGLVRFSNMNLAEDNLVLVEALVHEAIHTLLYKIEYVIDGFIKTENMNNHPVISPWSGNQIRLQSFLHAILIWHSIGCMWRRHSEISPEIGSKVRYRIELASKGFLNGKAAELLEKNCSHMEERTFGIFNEFIKHSCNLSS